MMLTHALLDLTVLQLHRRGAAEDGDGDAKALAVLVDLLHRAGEALERTVGDATLKPRQFPAHPTRLLLDVPPPVLPGMCSRTLVSLLLSM